MPHILAIDQGTTSSRAILFDGDMAVAHAAQQEFTQIYPQSGWVEHDVEEIWDSVVAVCKDVVAKVDDIAAIGITNQRETTIVWNRETGKPIHNAIVWQDRRTSAFCEELRAEGFEAEITQRTGLLADPYFSATKVRYILQTVEGAQEMADAGKLAFGTVDSFLIWRMTHGARHVTDATNAARTMLYNIRDGHWDEVICKRFGIPMSMLPEVLDCAADFGTTDMFGPTLPILGVAGDQQAATIGQACFAPGMLKSTYGTGCFALLNTGDELVTSQNRLLGTIAYQLDGKTTYALEGSIFIAGAVVQWLRDGLGIIKDAKETQSLAEEADPSVELYLVPAFTGLGAPYWDAEARGAVFGLTRNAGPAEFARAALESVGFQTRDLLDAMKADWDGAQDGTLRGTDPTTLRATDATTLRATDATTLRATDATTLRVTDATTLRVDGGMSASNWAMQFLADIIGAPVDRPQVLETTALGAAWLAGMRSGIYPAQDEFASTWALDRQFTPAMEATDRDRRYAGWKDAIRRTRN